MQREPKAKKSQANNAAKKDESFEVLSRVYRKAKFHVFLVFQQNFLLLFHLKSLVSRS